VEQTFAAFSVTEEDIPENYRIKAALHQDYYLVDGELRHWDGPMQKVLSPVQMTTGTGSVRKLVGEAPLLSVAAAQESLNVAVAAYDNGRGTWPTMSVGERIRCVARFSTAVQEKRDEIVKLLMWEIGKSLQEAEGECDRALAYIRDTLEALKELDRVSSRFVIQQGIIGQIRRAPLGVVLCMGPYNFPLYETFTTLIPALVMGNTIVLKPPRFGILLFAPLLDGLPGCLSPRGGQYGLRRRRGGAAAAACLGTGGRPRFHRHPQGGRRAARHPSAPAPAALRARAGRQEPGDHPSRCRPGPGRCRMPAGEPLLQRPALHGAENYLRAPLPGRHFSWSGWPRG